MDLITPVLEADQGFEEARRLIEMSRLLVGLRKATDVASTTEELRSLFGIAASPGWRRQVYSAVIVQTYATHEKFVRELAKAAGAYLAQTYSTYQDLPQRTQDEHMKLSIRRLQDVTERGHAKDIVDPETILNRLTACFGGGVQLNIELLVKHPANYRKSVVEEVFGRFGLDVRTSASNEDLSVLVGGVLNGVYASIESVVDDLAERRNQVAHGGPVNATLGDEDLGGIIDAIAGYDFWLARHVARMLLLDLVERNGMRVAVADRTWTNHSTGMRSIVRLVDVDVKLAQGDLVYCLSSRKGGILPCTIYSIQVNNQPVAVANPGGGPYAVDLGHATTRGAKLIVLANRWRSLAGALVKASTAMLLPEPDIAASGPDLAPSIPQQQSGVAGAPQHSSSTPDERASDLTA